MRDYLNAARMHLVDRLTVLVLPTAVLAFAFAASMALFLMSSDADHRYSGGLLALPCFLAVIGVTMLTRSLPFAIALGLTRRAYYVGALAMAAVLSAGWSVVVTLGAVVEGASGGWGMRAHFFRIPWATSGGWYQVFLGSFAAMTLLFVLGLWWGLIFKRWGIIGIMITVGVLALALIVATVLIEDRDAWAAVGAFVGDIGVMATSGLVIALAALLALAGYPIVRRTAV